MARTITSAEDVHSMPHKRRGAIVSGARTGTGKILGMVSTGESLGLFCSSFLFRAAENFCHRPGDFFSLPGDVTGLFQLNMLRLRRGGDCFVTSSAVPKPPSSSSSSSSTTVATTDDDEEDDDDDNDDDDDDRSRKSDSRKTKRPKAKKDHNLPTDAFKKDEADTLDRLREAVRLEGKDSDLVRLLAQKLIQLRKAEKRRLKHEVNMLKLSR